MTKHHTEKTPEKHPETAQETPTAAAPNIAALTDEVAQWKDVALRSQADMDNLRKRTQLEMQKAEKYAVEDFAGSLLPVIDGLEAALSHAKNAPASENSPLLNGLIQGVDMTLKQALTALKKQGVEPMAGTGTVFDPERHQVIQQTEADAPTGTIIQELQRGYTIGGDRVLREAMVITAK